MKNTLIELVNKIDNVTADADTYEEDLDMLADMRRKVVNQLLGRYREDYLVGQLGVCVCECHFDMSIQFDGNECISCKCFNEFRNVNRP